MLPLAEDPCAVPQGCCDICLDPREELPRRSDHLLFVTPFTRRLPLLESTDKLDGGARVSAKDPLCRENRLGRRRDAIPVRTVRIGNRDSNRRSQGD